MWAKWGDGNLLLLAHSYNKFPICFDNEILWLNSNEYIFVGFHDDNLTQIISYWYSNRTIYNYNLSNFTISSMIILGNFGFFHDDNLTQIISYRYSNRTSGIYNLSNLTICNIIIWDFFGFFDDDILRRLYHTNVLIVL